MDQKKKPAPGATLISRLREGRQRREQALVERKARESHETVTRGDETKQAGIESQNKSSLMPRARSTEAVAAVRKDAPAKDARAVHVEAQPQPAELIHRAISIADLRPASDDYALLTEEIRLAGRFAAAGLIAQGLRLARLNDDHIYKHNYSTFEEYCRQEHLMSATYAYRLIRMSEMAERLAEEGCRSGGVELAASMPDPFEVMLSLGHRHLLALLPVEAGAAEELLLRGVPVVDESGKLIERIPIGKATEQQIRQALKVISLPAEQSRTQKKLLKVLQTKTVRSLPDLVDVLQNWVDWLESKPDPSTLADKVGQGRDKKRLIERTRTLVDRMLELIE